MPGAKTDTIKLNIGPQHPSTHGVLYIKAELDGEIVKNAEPQLGYLHRAIEKLSENRYYHQALPAVDRCDYLCPNLNELVYCMAVEKLAGIKVAERAEYIRVIMAELHRITGHMVWAGSLVNDLGAMFTPLLYSVRDREKLLDLVEKISGSRMFPNYNRFGGVKLDIPEGWLQDVLNYIDIQEKNLVDFRNLVESEIFDVRTKGVAKLTTKQAINFGLTGPLLRATGFDWDLRRDEPYSIYDRFDFNVITEKDGDLRAIYNVRIAEVTESFKIIRQAVKDIPAGPICNKVPSPLRPDKGDCYVRIESSKGELGVYLVSDGSDKPYRLKLRTPSFCNLRAVQELVKDYKLADLIAIVGSIDIVLGDVDR
ncbi:MAG: NADH-quinone oxidoreductase subunit D [Actinobacteria bacterium]|nr:MAG: NADH-quinone oxidoreductase subunit D [Actinomycetota bacterium]